MAEESSSNDIESIVLQGKAQKFLTSIAYYESFILIPSKVSSLLSSLDVSGRLPYNKTDASDIQCVQLPASKTLQEGDE